MAEFDNENSPEDRLMQEAEELMRQKRFSDAATRYQDLRRTSPTDLWASLGYASALECAGKVAEAERILEEAALRHRRSAPLHRFRHMFFVRREDIARAAGSQHALQSEGVEEGPEDQLADLYFNQGRYHEARAELERLLREDSIEEDELKASVLARVGACMRQNDELEPAREKLIEALALDPGHHWILSELAEVERALGNIDAARRRYTEALEANGEDHWCRGHLAQMECEEGNIDRAVELYRHILTEMPKAAWAKVELAQVVAERDAKESERLCLSALDDDPTYPWAHAQLANLARRIGKHEEAREQYRQALAGSPDAIWILHELADVCRNLGRMEEAYAHLEHARRIDPYDATTYGYFADLLRHESKNSIAVAHLEKAVELDADYAWAWRELAELRAIDGKHEQAEEAYRRAVELEPDEAINDGLKAFLLRCAGKRDAALPYLERAVERQSDYLWAWRERVDLLLGRGRWAEAETVARAAQEALPESPAILAQLAETLRRQGKRIDAGAAVAKALELAPESPQLWSLRAELALEVDEPGAAVRCAERAASLDASPEYQALHAQALISADRSADAEAIVKRLIAAPKPIPAACELASHLAEQDGRLDEACDWCERALTAGGGRDPRLIVRRARIGMALREADATDRLEPLLVAGAPAPWREIGHLLAQSGKAVLARRAAYLDIAATAEARDEEQAKSWLHLAEVELALGNGEEAGQALARALARDDDCVPGHVLGAVLAEQRGDLATAIRHLEHLDRRLHEREEDEGPRESALLLRQLASLHERAGALEAAERCWDRAREQGGDALIAEHGSFLLRRGRRADAERALDEVLAHCAQPGEAQRIQEVQRLLRDLAVARAEADGPRAGREDLGRRRSALGAANRLLSAQLALLAGDVAAADDEVARLRADEGDSRPLMLLAARVHLAARRLDTADELLRRLRQEQESDEESAVLYAESLAHAGRFADAIAALAAPGLPHRAGSERALLAALLRLEAEGEASFLTALGRAAAPSSPTSAARLIAAAWPGVWVARGAMPPPSPDDGLHLPPYPRMVARLGRALAGHGRDDVAANMLLATAAVLARDGRDIPARRLRAQAAASLRRLGRRWAALREAIAGRSIRAALRCLWPF